MSYRIQRPLGAEPPPEAVEPSLMPLDLRRGFVQVPTYDVRQYVQTTLITLALGFGAGVTVGAIFGNILGTRKAENVGKLFRNRRRRSSRRPRRNAAKRPGLRIEQLMLDGYISKSDLKDGPWESLGGFAPRRRLTSTRDALDWLADQVQKYGWHGAFRVVNARGDVLGHARYSKRNAGKRRTSARKRKRGRPAGGPVNDRLTVKLPDGQVDVEVRGGDVLVGGRRLGSVYDLGTTFRAIPRFGDVRSYGTLAGAVKHVIRDAEAA